MPNALLSWTAALATARPTARGQAGPSPKADVAGTLSRAYCAIGLVGSLMLAAVAALSPEGTGWRWADPLTELWWYADGWDSPATMLQLFGNLALFALPAAFAVRLWPPLRRHSLLIGVSLFGGIAIETLQWLLPIGRVVSPVDALLNATGALLAALLTMQLHRRRATGGGRLPAAS
jgi:hypothetical protein